MAKIIRSKYPTEISIGLLLLVFIVSGFLSYQIFEISGKEISEIENAYLGIFLVATAVIIMALVLWEEFLFPVKVKKEADGMVFRNHRTKLKTQLLIYSLIPAIFAFIYFQMKVNLIPFIIWAAICIIAPIVAKLISGLKNYNDFLKLTDDAIEYRNNEKKGVFKLKDVLQIVLLKDEYKVLHKIQLLLTDKQEVTIDLDQMEIDVFCSSIDQYITEHYNKLVKG